MSVTCSICLGSSTGADEALDHFGCVPCGHLFHISCIDQWLRTKRACPECRFACNQNNIVRLFLKHDNLEVSVADDAEEECSALVAKYRNRIHQNEERIEKMRAEMTLMEKQFEDSVKQNHEQEKLIKDLRVFSRETKKHLSTMEMRLQESLVWKERVRSLEESNAMLSRIKTCVEGNFLDVQNMLVEMQSECDTSHGRETLIACVESLKKEMSAVAASNKKLLRDTENWQAKERKFGAALSECRKEIKNLTDKLHDSEEGYKMMSNKLTSLERMFASKPDLPQTQIKRFIHENPAPEGLFGSPNAVPDPIEQFPLPTENETTKRMKKSCFSTPNNFQAVQKDKCGFLTPNNFLAVAAQEDTPLNAGKRALNEKKSARVGRSIFGEQFSSPTISNPTISNPTISNPTSSFPTISNPTISSPTLGNVTLGRMTLGMSPVGGGLSPVSWPKVDRNPFKKQAVKKKGFSSRRFGASEIIDLDL